nr:hypothetical protein [Lentzea atacamensis]
MFATVGRVDDASDDLTVGHVGARHELRVPQADGLGGHEGGPDPFGDRTRFDVVAVEEVDDPQQRGDDAFGRLRITFTELAGLHEDGGDAEPGRRGVAVPAVGVQAEDDVLVADDGGHGGGLRVELLVAGEAVADEVAQELVDAAGVQVDERVGALDDVLEEPRRQPLGRAALGIAGEDAVDVDPVERGRAEPSVVDGRRVGDEAEQHLAAHLLRVEAASEPVERVDAGELTAVHAGGDHHAWARPAAVDQGHRDVRGERAQLGAHAAAHLGPRPGAQRADGEGGSGVAGHGCVTPPCGSWSR